MSCPDALAITWPVNSLSGYGLYALQTAMQFLRQGGKTLILAGGAQQVAIPENAPQDLLTAITLGQKIADFLRQNPEQTLAFAHAVLFAVGNDGRGFAGQDRIWGKPAIGCAAIEHNQFTAHGLEVIGRYDRLITISRWNEQILRNLNLAPVSLCWQGIATQLFYPGPRGARWRDRFVIFSGGKFEFRKAQDVVVAAFKRFRAKYPEALLICAWQTPYQSDTAPFVLAGHCDRVPQPDGQGGLNIDTWLQQQGLPPESFVDLPYTPNPQMPDILINCDAALFPNRCEGGTNLVAMEALACGVPSIVAANTGQLDLIELFDCLPLRKQQHVTAPADFPSVVDWRESDIDEIVAALEQIYQDSAARQHAISAAKKLQAFDWSIVSDRLLQTITS